MDLAGQHCINDWLKFNLTASILQRNVFFKCYQYIIPDLLSIWPWKRLCNPMLDEVKDETNAWVKSLDLFEPAQLQMFYGFDFSTYIHP